MPDPCPPLDRHAQIVELLRTHHDHLPQPTRRDDATTPGFVHHVKVRESCPDCLANSPVPMPGCETCRGVGYTEHLRERDPYAVDKVQPYGLDIARHEETRERDQQIARLGRQLAPARSEADLLEEANRHGYPWERMRERLYEEFDHAPLDRALEQLHQADDGAYRLVYAVHVYGWLEPSAVVEAAVQRALRFIDERMPDPIRSPGMASPAPAKTSLWRGRTDRHAQARLDRDRRVIRAHFAWGWDTGQIAAHESLSRRRVQQILDGVTAVASGPAA